MGIFDMFKKQKNVEAEAETTVEAVNIEEAEAQTEAEAPAKVQEKVQEDVPKEECADEFRRFTMLVEDMTSLPEGQGVVVGGILHGSVQVGDEIYIIHPVGSVIMTKVNGVQTGPRQVAERAENQRITMLLEDIKEVTQVPKYTVITSIKPQASADAKETVENPHLLGLSMDYPRLCKDTAYMNLMIYVLCHTNYMVPVHMVPNEAMGGKEPTMHFPALQNPSDPSINLFPVFTDGIALSNWKNLFDETHPPKSVIMRFPDVVSVSNGNGVILNAFGPTPVFLPAKMIEQIVSMEGYKQEFSAANTPNPQENRMMVGVPKDNEEIRQIKDAMIAYAKKEEGIKRIDFLLKVDMQQERAYLCVVDCPQEQATELFTQLHKAVEPYLSEVKRFECLVYGKSRIAIDVVSEKSMVYQV